MSGNTVGTNGSIGTPPGASTLWCGASTTTKSTPGSPPSSHLGFHGSASNSSRPPLGRGVTPTVRHCSAVGHGGCAAGTVKTDDWGPGAVPVRRACRTSTARSAHPTESGRSRSESRHCANRRRCGVGHVGISESGQPLRHSEIIR